MLLLDLSHTSHTTAQTGIQRVCRSLHAQLKRDGEVMAVTYDPHERVWRGLAPWEERNLTATTPVHGRGARWPLTARLSGRTRRWFSSTRRGPEGAGLLVPEVFSPAAASHFSGLFRSVSGPRVALFHDAIALKLPELTPQKTVARFPAYLRELVAFDGIAAVSEDSKNSLVDYWRWLGVSNPPPVIALPLPLGQPVVPRRKPLPAAGAAGSVECGVLSVGSVEGRKNHLALLEACEQLWSLGGRFNLRLIGLAHPQTGRAALDRIRQLQAAGRPLRYDGPVEDETLLRAYEDCTFTVYPSLSEGFGLPVLESLAHGKPCICSARGALGESARGGGCLALGSVEPASLAPAIQKLLTDDGFRGELEAQARRRTFRTWPDFARDLTRWMGSLSRIT